MEIFIVPNKNNNDFLNISHLNFQCMFILINKYMRGLFSYKINIFIHSYFSECN